ncbi:MAG: branched-chain amino acid ABC transporter substrate-binding protein, partial [Vulcanimicrobiaceae bacterium]
VPARAAFGDLPFAATTTIAVAGPFSGADAALGAQMESGVRGAIDEANLARGTFDRLFTIRTFDDQNLLAAGILTSQYIVNDGTVAAVIGHLSGRITEAVEQTYAQGNLPIVVPTSSYDRLTAGGYANVRRLPTKDSAEGRFGAQYIIKQLAPKLVAVLVQDGDYGADVAAGAVAELQARKVPILPQLFSWDKPNFAEVAQKTAAGKPDVVYLAGLTHDMGPVVHALRAAGYAGPLIASQGFFDPATIKQLGNDAAGLIASSSMPPLALAPDVFHLAQDYASHYGPLTPIAAFCYAAAQIVIAAARRTGAADRASLGRALQAPLSYQTLVGSFQFQPTGDPLDPNVYFYKVENGAWKYVRAGHVSSFILR